jgi:sirohydrochlorin ferrochelatase
MDKCAVVIVAHGDRAGRERNAALLSHTDYVRRKLNLGHVTCGVLNGEPDVQLAFEEISAGSFDKVLIYPFFMSNGYFVDRILPERLIGTALTDIAEIMTPLGLEERLPKIMLNSTLEAARSKNFSPEESSLLVVGHGSKYGRASAASTENMAANLAALSQFSRVSTAYLEEHPFLHSVLTAERNPLVIAGFFAGDGMHAHEDVPVAIEETGANAVYTGPIGTHPAISDLICKSITVLFQSAGHK